MEPYAFSEENEKDIVSCPVCYNKMEYICSEDINDETHLVSRKWWDEKRQKSHPENKSFKPSTPKVTCPYCKSTNTKKISGLSKAVSVGIFGIFALGKTTKQFHCNNCSADF
jgi:uncharacterized protein YbaR (Trm112 family)